MDTTPRPVNDDELTAFLRAEAAGFGHTSTDEEIARARERYLERRVFGIQDSGQFVATGANLDMTMTVPGGALLPMAGVTAISTRPTHRRRGLITSVIARLLDDAEERGEPLAGLWASESVIYGRFGFGIAVENESWEIERVHAAFAANSTAASGAVRMVEPVADARAACEQVWARMRATQPGMPERSARMWSSRFDVRREPPVQFAVLYEEDGRCDGYALYRIRMEPSPDGHERNEVIVQELIAASDAAYAALWRFLCSIDLTRTIRAPNQPVDSALPWMLADPRRLSRRRRDAIWLRIIDVPRTLEARTYGVSGSLVIEVADAFRPQSGGRFRLDAGEDGARCTRTDAGADIALSAADLAAMYLGGVALSVLARAGRVQECVAGAVARADALFATERAPWCPQHW